MISIFMSCDPCYMLEFITDYKGSRSSAFAYVICHCEECDPC